MLQTIAITAALLCSAPSDDVGVQDESLAAAVVASNGLGVELFKSLANRRPEGNVFFSPFSIAVALTMVAEGARDETEAEFAASMHFPIVDGPDRRAVTIVHEGFAEFARRLVVAQRDADERVGLRIAEARRQLDAAKARTRELEAEGDRVEVDASHDYAAYLAFQLNELLRTAVHPDLRTANALWVDRHYPLSPRYTETIDRYYGAGMAKVLDIVDDPAHARERINEWVEEQTEHRIKELIPIGSLGSAARLVITNALYFKGEWRVPFDERTTRPEPFTKADGEATEVRMMSHRRHHDVRYAAFNGDGTFFDTPTMVAPNEADRQPTYPDDDGFQILELPYTGGNLAMAVLLPRSAQGLPALEDMLSATMLDAWLDRLDRRTVDTSVPRFRIEYQTELSDALIELGLGRAFISPDKPRGAQFPGMTSSTDLFAQLYIGAVLHKAWVEVAERGTEAAAATAVIMAPGSAIGPRPLVPFTPVFRADRPFLFLIRDTQSGMILFMGRVGEPA